MLPPGVLVNTHVPVDGKPVITTLPVDTAHDGWVIAPTEGAAGTGGGELMTILFVEADVHPSALVTVKVYVFAGRPVMVVVVPEPV